MNFIDLCAGIGGIRLGLEQAGHTCVGFCEFDKFALQSYKAIHNTEGEWEAHDITKVTDDEIRELSATRTIEIVCGGFPCQAFSVAGKKQGFNDLRGNIFFEICRFIKIIRPRYFVCENVKGLLSHENGRTFGIILSTLAELGYSVEWQILNSKDYGVPQNRERVFLVGHTGDGSRGKVFPIRRADGENPCKLQEIAHGVADAYRTYKSDDGLSRTLKSEGGGLGAKTGLYTVQQLCTIDKPVGTKGGTGALKIKNVGIDHAGTVTARYYKGLSANSCNGVVCIQKTHGNTTTVKIDETGVLQAARLDKVPNVVCPVSSPEITKKAQNGRRMKEPGDPMFTLTGRDRHGVAIIDDQGRQNKKLELKDHVPTLRAQSHGNKPKVISGLYTGVSKDFHHPPLEDLSRTLKAGKHDAGITDGIRIRKLTPRECWRLQGFPDEYFDRAKAAGVSDTQLYKQAGNAVTVNVARVIGESLTEIEGD